jgi:hypothetical protein
MALAQAPQEIRPMVPKSDSSERRAYPQIPVNRSRAAAVSAESDRGAFVIMAMTALAAGAVMMWAATYAQANSGTVEDQAACTPDVFRLCSSEIPSEERIVACLNAKIRKLSPECRQVMAGEPEPKPERKRRQ